MNLNVNEERGILWWADVYRLYSSLIAIIQSWVQVKDQLSLQFLLWLLLIFTSWFLHFLKFLPMRMGWVMSWNLPSQTDTVCLVFRVSKGCFCLTLSCSSLRREVAFFLSHCCRQTDLLRSHILWSIMWVSLEVDLGPVKSSIDATIIRVLRF